MEFLKVEILMGEKKVIKRIKMGKRIYYIWILDFYIGNFGYKN